MLKKVYRIKKNKEFQELRAQRDLLPLDLTGEKLDQYVDEHVKELRELSQEFGLVE